MLQKAGTVSTVMTRDMIGTQDEHLNAAVCAFILLATAQESFKHGTATTRATVRSLTQIPATALRSDLRLSAARLSLNTSDVGDNRLELHLTVDEIPSTYVTG
jgi:hypothetical protein